MAAPLRSHGAGLEQGFNALAAEVAVVAPSSGIYTLVVATGDSGLDAIGNYQLTLARTASPYVVPTSDHGGPMTNAATHTGAIHQADLDQWTFTATARRSINISVGELGGDSQFTPWIRVYGPTGAGITQSFGAVTAQVTINIPTSGRYRVVVASADSGYDAAGSYFVKADGIDPTDSWEPRSATSPSTSDRPADCGCASARRIRHLDGSCSTP